MVTNIQNTLEVYCAGQITKKQAGDETADPSHVPLETPLLVAQTPPVPPRPATKQTLLLNFLTKQSIDTSDPEITISITETPTRIPGLWVQVVGITIEGSHFVEPQDPANNAPTLIKQVKSKAQLQESFTMQ